MLRTALYQFPHVHFPLVRFFPITTMSNQFPVQKTPAEWAAKLTVAQYDVLRLKGTERPHTGAYTSATAAGVYSCAGCEKPLYSSAAKFDAHCGWPAFYEALPGAIKTVEDRTGGMVRTEMVCSGCGGHLGHIFKGEGFKTPTDARHCVNSVSLRFADAKDAPVA